MPLNGFYARNNQSRKIPYFTEFDETLRFWYPLVAHDVWIDFSLGPSRFDRQNVEKISLFVFLSPFFLSFSIRFFSLPCLLFFFFSFLSSLIHPHFFLLFVSSLSLFISFHFLFSHFLFSSFFSFLLLIASPTRMDQVGETSSQFPP